MKSKGKSLRGTAFQLLALSDRTSSELRVRLLRRGFCEQKVMEMLAELKGRGYLDDEKLAREMVRKQLIRGRTGPLRMRHELVRRGVPGAIAEQAIEEACAEADVEEIALELAVKRLKTTMRANDTEAQEKGRLGRYLLRRGFTPATVNWVVAQLFDGPEPAGAD